MAAWNITTSHSIAKPKKLIGSVIKYKGLTVAGIILASFTPFPDIRCLTTIWATHFLINHYHFSSLISFLPTYLTYFVSPVLSSYSFIFLPPYQPTFLAHYRKMQGTREPASHLLMPCIF